MKKRQVATVQVKIRVIAVIQNMHHRQLKDVSAPERQKWKECWYSLCVPFLIRLCLILLTLVNTD